MIPDISLYGIIDPQIARGRSLADLAGIAARSSMTLLQFRAKTMETRRMIAEARAIHDALAGTGVPLLINDRVDVALAAGAVAETRTITIAARAAITGADLLGGSADPGGPETKGREVQFEGLFLGRVVFGRVGGH